MLDQSPADAANISLWDSLRAVDPAFTKKITGKAYSGDSPNPQWMIRKATEALGPIGERWGWTVVGERIQEGKPVLVTTQQVDHWMPPKADGDGPVLASREVTKGIIRELYHYIHIRFWRTDETGRVCHYDAMGGTPMLIFTSKQQWMMDEDASKKSLTDAITKGLSWLGVAADLFLGLYDDKYQAPLGRDPVDVTPETKQLSAPQDHSDAGEPAPAPKPKAREAEPKRTTTQPAGW